MTDQTAPSITPDPDRDGVILHLPEITYLDTQVWSVDIGLTGAGLAALRTALAAPAAVPPPADRAGLHKRIAEALRYWVHPTDRATAAAAVLAVLPEPADRAAVLRDAADRIDAETRQAKTDGVLEPWKFRPCRDASAQLRRMADEAQQQRGTEARETVHGCPPDGSGLTPCCGRTPFELPLGDRISSEAPITCPGPAPVQQPAADEAQDGERP